LSRVVEITAAHILSEKYSRKIASMLWQWHFLNGLSYSKFVFYYGSKYILFIMWSLLKYTIHYHHISRIGTCTCTVHGTAGSKTPIVSITGIVGFHVLTKVVMNNSIVHWKSTDVSEEHVVSIFGVEEWNKQETSMALFAICFKLLSCLAYFSLPNREATWSSDTSVHLQQTTQRYKSEDRILHHWYSFKSRFMHKRINYLNICTPREMKQRLFAFSVRKCLASESVRMGVKPTWQQPPISLT
jgi:hypothetical protein